MDNANSRNGMVNEVSIGILLHVPLRNYVMKRGKIRMGKDDSKKNFQGEILFG